MSDPRAESSLVNHLSPLLILQGKGTEEKKKILAHL
jgi:hypothetical protein